MVLPLRLTVKFPALPSHIFISFTVSVGEDSSSVIVATPLPSLIDALLGLERTTLNVSAPSYSTSCSALTSILPLVHNAGMLSVPHVYT